MISLTEEINLKDIPVKKCMPEVVERKMECVYCNSEESMRNEKLPSTKTQVVCYNVKFLCASPRLVCRTAVSYGTHKLAKK